MQGGYQEQNITVAMDAEIKNGKQFENTASNVYTAVQSICSIPSRMSARSIVDSIFKKTERSRGDASVAYSFANSLTDHDQEVMMLLLLFLPDNHYAYFGLVNIKVMH